ncbi:MAG TPA: MFS transporter [Gaiellaceae bacterium]
MRRALSALLVAETISTTGSQMTWLALPWFVLITSGSPTRMSLVMAAELAGYALAGLPSGRVLSLLGARRTMLGCDGARAPLMALVPILHWTGGLSFGVIVAVALASGVLSSPYMPAQRVLLPQLLGEDESALHRANSLFQGATRLTMLLGPVLAGVLIGLIGAPSVLLVDAGSYVVAVALVGVYVPVLEAVPAAAETRKLLAGIRFLLREPLLRSWNASLLLGDTAWQAIFAALPVLVVAHYSADARVAGALFAAFGVGAVLGNAVAYLKLREVDGLRLVGSGIRLLQAAPLWALAAPLPAWAAVLALGVSGVANGLVNPSLHTVLTLRIPPALRPATMTAMMTLFAVCAPLGLVGAGPALSAFGTTPVFLGCAAAQTVAMIWLGLGARHACRAGLDSVGSQPAPGV